jgi:hypothetical protein
MLSCLPQYRPIEGPAVDLEAFVSEAIAALEMPEPVVRRAAAIVMQFVVLRGRPRDVGRLLKGVNGVQAWILAAQRSAAGSVEHLAPHRRSRPVDPATHPLIDQLRHIELEEHEAEAFVALFVRHVRAIAGDGPADWLLVAARVWS